MPDTPQDPAEQPLPNTDDPAQGAPEPDAAPTPEGEGDAPTEQSRDSLFRAPPLGEQERMIEAMLFATSEPLSVAEMSARMPHGCDAAEAVQLLRRRYGGRGVQVVRVGDAWAIRTAPDLGFLMARETVETRKLSRAAIETLAIAAYHQPVTRAEIEEIRGVSVSRGTVDQLIELGWLRFGRRRMTPGRPVTYVVTQGFLDHFGLETARDLPGLKELREAGMLESRPPDAEGPDLPEDETGELFDETLDAEDDAGDDDDLGDDYDLIED